MKTAGVVNTSLMSSLGVTSSTIAVVTKGFDEGVEYGITVVTTTGATVGFWSSSPGSLGVGLVLSLVSGVLVEGISSGVLVEGISSGVLVEGIRSGVLVEGISSGV